MTSTKRERYTRLKEPDGREGFPEETTLVLRSGGRAQKLTGQRGDTFHAGAWTPGRKELGRYERLTEGQCGRHTDGGGCGRPGCTGRQGRGCAGLAGVVGSLSSSQQSPRAGCVLRVTAPPGWAAGAKGADAG